MLIRYFAEITHSPIGAAAASFTPALRALGQPLRLISVGGVADLDGVWKQHLDLMNTPLQSDYQNVVCCEPHRWRYGALGGVVEIYTPGKRNVLLVPKGLHLRERKISAAELASALKYEVVVADPADHGWWLGWGPKSLLASDNPKALEIALG